MGKEAPHQGDQTIELVKMLAFNGKQRRPKPAVRESIRAALVAELRMAEGGAKPHVAKLLARYCRREERNTYDSITAILRRLEERVLQDDTIAGMEEQVHTAVLQLWKRSTEFAADAATGETEAVEECLQVASGELVQQEAAIANVVAKQLQCSVAADRAELQQQVLQWVEQKPKVQGGVHFSDDPQVFALRVMPFFTTFIAKELVHEDIGTSRVNSILVALVQGKSYPDPLTRSDTKVA